jgi:putative ABC transport system permease protein
MFRSPQGEPMSIFRRIANLFSRSRLDRESDAELRAHVDLRTADNIASGMAPEEARRDAMLRFGNPAVIRERVAAADMAPALSSVSADVRYALRQLRKSPGFAAAVILTLALGIGPNTAVFSVMNSVLLRPLAYPRPERIVQFEKGTPSDSTYSASVALFLEWRRENTTFEHIAAYSVLPVGFNLAAEGNPERVPGLRVGADFFRVLGVAPKLGRDFAGEEDRSGASPVAILSSSLWRRRYGSDPGLVGKTIALDSRAYTVIGILPPGFQFLATMPTSKAIEIWTPLELPAASRDPSGILECIGRLRDGVSTEQAAAQMTALGHRAAAEVPSVFPSDGVVTLLPLQQRITGDTRPTILLFFGAVSFVLLIACANAANLMLARISSRAKEMGVRAALGASRFRILRQILTESVVLAISGGVLGLVIAWLCGRILIGLAPLAIARSGEVRMDWRVMLFALSVSLFTGIAAGLLPAVHMLGVGAADALRDSSARRATQGRSHRRISAALVTAEMALSLMLLIAAGLLIESFVKLQRVDPGFDYNNVGTFETTLSVAQYGNPAELQRFIRNVSQRIEASPGVENATALSSLPTEPTLSFPFDVEGGPAPAPGQSTGDSDYLLVSSGFFRTMRIPILKGRAIAESDSAQSLGVVVINQTMARKYFANQSPIGRRIVIARNLGPDWVDVPREVVGICGDAKNDSIDEIPQPTMYTPFSQASSHMITVLLGTLPLRWAVRSTTDPAALEGQLQGAISSVDAEEPMAEFQSIRGLLSDSLGRWRFNMILVGAFAVIALLLAAVGIFGVISYAVTQRTREIGIRMALGAGRASVQWMVLRHAGLLLGAGAVLGLAGLAGMGRLLKGFIYGVSFADAGVLFSVTALLCLVGLIAAWRPARRAASIDPMKALRSE